MTVLGYVVAFRVEMVPVTGCWFAKVEFVEDGVVQVASEAMGVTVEFVHKDSVLEAAHFLVDIRVEAVVEQATDNSEFWVLLDNPVFQLRHMGAPFLRTRLPRVAPKWDVVFLLTELRCFLNFVIKYF